MAVNPIPVTIQGDALSGASASQVQGTAADGAAAVGSPVQVGGKDGAGNVQALLTGTDGAPLVGGNIAHDAVDSGNPLKLGGKAASSLPAAVAAGDRVDAYFDLNGRLKVNLDTAIDETNDSIRATKLGTLTDRSGTIAVNATAQSMMAANSSRRYLFIQNNDTVSTLWFNFTTTAVQSQPSIKLVPGASFTQEGSYVSTEAISVIGPLATQIYTAKEG